MIEIKYRFGGKAITYKDESEKALGFFGVLKALNIRVISVSYCLVME